MKLVAVVTPNNNTYSDDAVAHSLAAGESPLSAAQLFAAVLSAEAVELWVKRADIIAFYVDNGMTPAMAAWAQAVTELGRRVEFRHIGGGA